MLSWLTLNAGNIIVSIIILAVVALVILKMVKDKASCGCGCANCALNGQCHNTSSLGSDD